MSFKRICNEYYLQILIFYLCSVQEFRGVSGFKDSESLETDMSSVPLRTVEVLASCHALVFVDNKLVC